MQRLQGAEARLTAHLSSGGLSLFSVLHPDPQMSRLRGLVAGASEVTRLPLLPLCFVSLFILPQSTPRLP